MFFLLIVFALALLFREGQLSGVPRAVICTALVLAAFVIRMMCMEHETLDYQNFLTVWVQYFRDNGGFSALSQSIGNYNVPYLYFLAIISYFDIYDLFLIKIISIFFDVLLAWGAMKLVGVVSDSRNGQLFAYIAVLFLPTVVLNGAYWGQCDCIYTCFAVLSIYCALSGRPKTSVVMIALSFSFKLQAVFIMPIFLAFIFTGRVKWWHLLIFPLTYIIIILPAAAAGRPFIDTLTLYINQGSTVGHSLNYNSPSLFALIRSENKELWSKLGVVLAFAFTAGVLAWLFALRRSLTDRTLLAATVLFAIGIPFLLPHMHDRYFFPADIFTLVFAVGLPQYFLVPILTQFASLLGYHAYLKSRYLMPMSRGSVSLIAAMILVMFFIASNTYNNPQKLRP